MARLTILGSALLATVLIAMPCSAREPFKNQWGPFTGTVVDAKTGQPIPGAVFTVFWMRTVAHLLSGVGSQEFYDARVTVADEAGHFEIPRREHSPLLFADHPHLSCVAPGYAPYHDVGAQYDPIQVKLRPLAAEEQQVRGSRDPTLGTIPDEKGKEFQKIVNLKRQQMGLPSMNFYRATIEGAPR